MTKIKTYSLNKISDNRGYFLKTYMSDKFDINEKELEVYITNAKPGESKGGHYHEKANEWFTLIKGECILILIDINTKKSTRIDLNEQDPKTIYVPPFIAHEFFNSSSEEFILLAVTDKVFRKEDTIPFKININENDN
jgi:dTDP-4-dehydrorhamnose 3,5-epimerase-like enzyme